MREKGIEEEKEKKRKMEVKEIAEKWEIWDKEKKAVKLEKEAKKLVSPRFYKWIYIFKKKVSKRMPMKKV